MDEVAKAKAKKEKKKAKRAATDDTPPPSKKAKTNGNAGKTDTAAWRKAHDIKVEPDDGSICAAHLAGSAQQRSRTARGPVRGQGLGKPSLFRLKLGPH